MQRDQIRCGLPRHSTQKSGGDNRLSQNAAKLLFFLQAGAYDRVP